MIYRRLYIMRNNYSPPSAHPLPISVLYFDFLSLRIFCFSQLRVLSGSSEGSHAGPAGGEGLLGLGDDLVGAGHALGAVLETGLLGGAKVAGGEVGDAVGEAALHDAHHHVHRGQLGHVVVATLGGSTSTTEGHICE